MDPSEFARAFLNQEKSDSIDSTKYLCGRFMKGKTEDDFLKLSDEPGKVLSWVCSGEMLGSLLGKNVMEAMNSIGFRLDWIQYRINDGTQFRLVVFPSSTKDVECVVVTWPNLWKLIADTYGKEVDEALEPFKKEIEQLDTTTAGAYPFEGGERINEIANLPVIEKHAHPDFLSVQNFLSIKEKTLYHARGFLDHSVGCNYRFTGTGKSPEGEIEMMTRNQYVKDIPGVVVIPLSLTQEDLDRFISSQQEKK